MAAIGMKRMGSMRKKPPQETTITMATSMLRLEEWPHVHQVARAERTPEDKRHLPV